MPYIGAVAREGLEDEITALVRKMSQGRILNLHPGEMNYVMTTLALESLPEDAGYEHFALVAGIFSTAADEFYRRAVASYECVKIAEHGDIEGYYNRVRKHVQDEMSVSFHDQ